MFDRRFAKQFIVSVLAFMTCWYLLSPRTSSFQLRYNRSTNTQERTSITSQDDLQSLLDFSIIGPPKMATTYLLHRLYQQPKLLSYPHEMHALREGNLDMFIKNMSDLPTCEGCKRFYKNPGDSYSPRVLDIYRKHFPKTKMVIGLRHPVLWFESFYSYMMRADRNFTSLPPADSPLFLGDCKGKGLFHVCADNSRYHCQLALLGKVKEAFHPRCNENVSLYQKYTPNPVFLYEIRQVGYKNMTQSKLFSDDLSNFLELDEAMLEWKKEDIEEYFAEKALRQKVLNICDNKYLVLRSKLMENARNASLWIRNYFIHSDDITISSREQFISLVEDWMVDPCIERNKLS